MSFCCTEVPNNKLRFEKKNTVWHLLKYLLTFLLRSFLESYNDLLPFFPHLPITVKEHNSFQKPKRKLKGQI